MTNVTSFNPGHSEDGTVEFFWSVSCLSVNIKLGRFSTLKSRFSSVFRFIFTPAGSSLFHIVVEWTRSCTLLLCAPVFSSVFITSI